MEGACSTGHTRTRREDIQEDRGQVQGTGPTTDGYMGEHVYAKLSEDGIIEPEMEVRKEMY